MASKPIGTALARSLDALTSPPPPDNTAAIERKAKRKQRAAARRRDLMAWANKIAFPAK